MQYEEIAFFVIQCLCTHPSNIHVTRARQLSHWLIFLGHGQLELPVPVDITGGRRQARGTLPTTHSKAKRIFDIRILLLL
jgi:hypothetical protein